MSCCDQHRELERTLAQAEAAVEHAGRGIKNLAAMSYSEVRAWEEKFAPLKKAVTEARAKKRNHRCAAQE